MDDSTVVNAKAFVGTLLITFATVIFADETREGTGMSVNVQIGLAALLMLAGLFLCGPVVAIAFRGGFRIRNWKRIWGSLAWVCLGVAIGFAIRASAWKDTPFPATNLAALLPSPVTGTPVVHEGRIGLNVGVRNEGPNIARDVQWRAGIAAVPRPLSRNLEQAFLEEFASKVSPAESDRRDMGPSQTAFKTLATEFSAEGVRDIRSGKFRLYVLTFARWRDATGDHTLARCNVLREPGTDKRMEDLSDLQLHSVIVRIRPGSVRHSKTLCGC